jgi:hypothetical protein
MGFFSGIGKALGGAAKGFVGSGGSPWGAALGGAMSLFGGRGGGGNAGMNYLNQIPGMAMGYLNPYTEEGKKAYSSLLDQYSNTSTTNQNQFPAEYSQMARDPNAFVNNLMKGYEPSRGYNYKQNQMLGAARNSAASGGFAGTQYDQAQQGELVRDLLGSDMGEYLSRIMGTQNAGLAGEERRLAGRASALGGMSGIGFNASSDLANILGSNLGQQATFDFANQRQRRLDRREDNNDRSALVSKLFDRGANGKSMFDSFSSKIGSFF